MTTATEVKERPIPFSTLMVKAIKNTAADPQERRPIDAAQPWKWQTRRLVDWEPIEPGLNLTFSGLELGFYNTSNPNTGWVLRSRDGRGSWNDRTRHVRCRYGVAGDRLWVQEKFAFGKGYDAQPSVGKRVKPTDVPKYAKIHYDADGPKPEWAGLWWPGRFMTRARSRFLLEVTKVRIERLHAITEEDAKAEGIAPFPKDPEGDCWTDGLHRTAYQFLWNSLHGWSGEHCWDKNPWVWVIEFRRIA